MNIRKLTALAVCTLAVGGAATSHASAADFEYWKRGTTIDGRIRGVCGPQCATAWYRAGSGNGGTNGCAYHNWIPNGRYGVRGHWDHYDGLIKGRVWYLDDYHCSNGVTRTELFIHSEERADQTSCGTPYDERYCWDGAGDYYSLGCIKVARFPVNPGGSDLGKIDDFHHGWGVTGVTVRS